MYPSVRKSVYILLCALLGALLFLVLHRIAVFCYLFLVAHNYAQFSMGLSYFDFLALDYATLILVLIAGAWYGIWLGIYWYEAVYEGDHAGFVGHLVRHYWPTKLEAHNLRNKIAKVEDNLREDMWELEVMAKRVEQVANSEVKPKKRVVRRKSAKGNDKN